MRKPDFDQLLAVLSGQPPERPTLFEFFLNVPFYEKLAGPDICTKSEPWEMWQFAMTVIYGFKNAGYDYACAAASDLSFRKKQVQSKESLSLNEGVEIYDRKSFENFHWPDPAQSDYSALDRAQNYIPDGMKLIVMGPGGVLENVIALVGFENLCMLLLDDPDFADKIFHAVGSRLVKYYQIAAAHPVVGACISNDDWGFKTQTMLSPELMRKYVFPWHRKIVETIHGFGKPAILHSCGNLICVMDDIIDVMKYDAKHSYEDNIIPVEDAYEKWHHRIAILGGIDLDFLCSSPIQKIQQRCKSMLERTSQRGGYALGSGNSIPEYVPFENYKAMITCAVNADERIENV